MNKRYSIPRVIPSRTRGRIPAPHACSGPARLALVLAGAGLACSPSADDVAPDVGRDDAGDAGDTTDVPDVPVGALVPVALPVEIHLTRDATLGPVFLTALAGTAAVIWGEQDPVSHEWSEPGFAVAAQDGSVATPAVHPPDPGRRPAGLVPQAEIGRLAYFTTAQGSDCASTLQRRSLDTDGRLLGSPVEVDTLDDALAVHVASAGGNAVALVAEGNACTTTRTEPEARMLVIGSSGTLTGSVPLGPAVHVSALATRPGTTGYLAIRDTGADGVLMNTITAGGGADRTWSIAHRDGTCECPSSTAALAAGGSEYLAAWAGEVDGVQSWYLHVGPYFDEAEWGPPPDVTALPASFSRPVGIAVFETQYVVAYVPSDGSVPFRVDLFDDSGVVQAGWSADVPGEVTWVAVASLGRRVAVAWVEVWDGAAAPTLLKVGVFERP